jgi:hypothetical protein
VGGACNTREGMKNAYKFFLENLKERDLLEDLGVDGKTNGS